jgi:hypothetical protein
MAVVMKPLPLSPTSDAIQQNLMNTLHQVIKTLAAKTLLPSKRLFEQVSLPRNEEFHLIR